MDFLCASSASSASLRLTWRSLFSIPRRTQRRRRDDFQNDSRFVYPRAFFGTSLIFMGATLSGGCEVSSDVEVSSTIFATDLLRSEATLRTERDAFNTWNPNSALILSNTLSILV